MNPATPYQSNSRIHVTYSNRIYSCSLSVIGVHNSALHIFWQPIGGTCISPYHIKIKSRIHVTYSSRMYSCMIDTNIFIHSTLNIYFRDTAWSNIWYRHLYLRRDGKMCWWAYGALLFDTTALKRDDAMDVSPDENTSLIYEPLHVLIEKIELDTGVWKYHTKIRDLSTSADRKYDTKMWASFKSLSNFW